MLSDNKEKNYTKYDTRKSQVDNIVLIYYALRFLRLTR